MNFEGYRNIFIAKEDDGIILQPKKSPAIFKFNCVKRENISYRLFVAGETGLFYLWRNEPDYPVTYHTITDALCNEVTRKAQYSLNLSREQAEDFEWRIYKKIMWKPVLSYLALTPVGESWKVGFWVKTKNLRVNDGGKLLMRVRVYEKKEGLHAHSLEQPLVTDLVIPVEEGSCDWVKIERELAMPEDKTAFVGVWFEGVNYTGEVYIESPFLVSEGGYNVLPDFSLIQPDREKFSWAAENLSRKEWPKFSVHLNGKEVFRGERFERIHRNASWEIDLPKELIKDENELGIQLISDYYSPTPYSIKEVRLLEQKGGAVALLSVPEFAIKGKPLPVLIRTEKENAEVVLNNGIVYRFEKKGLQVIKLNTDAVCPGEEFCLQCDGECVYGIIPPVFEKKEDDVITGTGDMIYVAQEEGEVEEYLSWYLSNNLGNFLTIRPSYRWSSTRKANEKVWNEAKRILSDYGVKYVHIMDGRETPGYAANPSYENLSSSHFLGRQKHENDGAVFYHSVNAYPYSNIYAWQIIDMRLRLSEEYPDNVTRSSIFDIKEYERDCAYSNRNPNHPRDLRLGMNYAVERLKVTRGDSMTRHTGPTVQFRCFMQAGYDWVGLETMYTTLEPHIAFLRGTAKAYGLKSWGVHNAVQWSSTPHDTPDRIRRFRLSLYDAYLQGATDINTEEGLWRLEEYYSGFHRFNDACIDHRKQQEDFYRYVLTHSRTGEFYTPMALLQGKYDPWKGFENSAPCGWRESYGEAEDGWQLLKTVYPLSKPGEPLYFHNCPSDRPMGYYTGAPKGNVDVLPIECALDKMNGYKSLAFVGYNCADKESFEKLESYVRMGGKLIMTRAHRTVTTWYEDVCKKNLAYDQSVPLGFADGEQVFAKDLYNGQQIDVCVNAKDSEVLVYTDSGKPLVCRYTYGCGEVVLFNVNAYPAHPAIKELYEKVLKETQTRLVECESVWVEANERVQFAVYNQDDGAKHIYFLAVDWYKEPSYLRASTLRIFDKTYTVEFPFGVMYKCVINDGIGAYCHSEDGEVLSVSKERIRVQGTGKQNFSILQHGEVKIAEIDFSAKSVAEIFI